MYYYQLILPSAETPEKYIQSTLKRRKRQVSESTLGGLAESLVTGMPNATKMQHPEDKKVTRN